MSDSNDSELADERGDRVDTPARPDSSEKALSVISRMLVTKTAQPAYDPEITQERGALVESGEAVDDALEPTSDDLRTMVAPVPLLQSDIKAESSVQRRIAVALAEDSVDVAASDPLEEFSSDAPLSGDDFMSREFAREESSKLPAAVAPSFLTRDTEVFKERDTALFVAPVKTPSVQSPAAEEVTTTKSRRWPLILLCILAPLSVLLLLFVFKGASSENIRAEGVVEETLKNRQRGNEPKNVVGQKPVLESSTNMARVDEVKPSDEVKSDEVKSDEVKSDEVKSDEVKSDEVKSDEVKSDEVKSDEVKSDEVKSDEVKTPPAPPVRINIQRFARTRALQLTGAPSLLPALGRELSDKGFTSSRRKASVRLQIGKKGERCVLTVLSAGVRRAKFSAEGENCATALAQDFAQAYPPLR